MLISPVRTMLTQSGGSAVRRGMILHNEASEEIRCYEH